MLVDENPLAIEIDPRTDPAEPHDLEVFLGDEQQGINSQRCIGGKMHPVERIIGCVGNEFVELEILLVTYVRFVPGPQSLNGIDRVSFQLYGKRDEGGILFDDRFHFPLFGIILTSLFERDDYFRASMESRTLADCKRTGAVGHPFMPFRTIPGATLHTNLGPGHKGRVKSDPELTDEADVLASRLSQVSQKTVGSRVGDGSQVGDELIPGHTDAGIGYGQLFLFLIKIYGDLQRHMGIEEIFLIPGQALVPILFQSVCPV